jgi:hypothetical protein
MILQDLQIKERLDYRYKGKNYIEAFTLYNSQLHFLNAIVEIQKKSFPEFSLKIEVVPAEKGSHLVPIIFELIPIAGLFAGTSVKEGVEYIKSIIDFFKALIDIHVELKGERPIKETIVNDESTKVDFGNNNSFHVNTMVFNFYKENPHTISEINQSFKALENNKEVEGIEITTENKESLLDVNKPDFTALANQSPYIKQQEEEYKDRFNVTVFVKTTNFYPIKGKIWIWEFIYNGLPIKAKITDAAFADLINNGTRFGQGDRLEVDLRVHYKDDSRLKTLVIKSYEITKVHNQIYRSEGQKLQLPF